jgi:hypothetical protein
MGMMIEGISEFMMTPVWGGNVAGFIVGAVSCVMMAYLIYRWFYPKYMEELSDADFMSISLQNMDAEDDFRKALEEDDQYD